MLRSIDSKTRTVQRATLDYVKERAGTGEFNPATAVTVGNVLLRFAAVAGPDKPLRNLSGRHVTKWLASMDVSPATARARLSMVRTFCRWSMGKGWIKTDPTLGIKGPRQPRMIPRGLKHEQVAKLVNVVPDERGQVMVSLMVQEGLRCVEVSRLQIGDTDLDDLWIRVKGKFDAERVLPLSPDTANAIRAYLAVHPCRNGPLVRSYNHGNRPIHPSYVSKLLSAWLKDAGVKRTPYDRVSGHALRHTALSDMLIHGAELRDVQAAAGHASIATTQIYLPMVVKGLREAMGGRSYRAATAAESAENHSAAS